MTAAGTKRGALLLTFGGPESLDAVEPFMTRVMGGRKPPSQLVSTMIERYKLIGGKSPLPEVSRIQAQLVEEMLRSEGEDVRVFVGMLHSPPFIKDTLKEMINEGIEELSAVSLSAHFANVTTGKYSEEINRAALELGADLKIQFAGSYHLHPLFINGLVDRLEEILAEISDVNRSEIYVIFSAHSLPLAHIAGGDPYCDQLLSTVHAVIEKTGVCNWELGYQSKGGGQLEWLEPSVETIMDRALLNGFKHILVSPVGFATDHIETMYDIDIAQKQYAESLGLNFHRARALNTESGFIKVLAETIKESFSLRG